MKTSFSIQFITYSTNFDCIECLVEYDEFAASFAYVVVVVVVDVEDRVGSRHDKAADHHDTCIDHLYVNDRCTANI